jgi:hypothetical protein
MKKTYSFYMFIGVLITSLLFLLGLKYPTPLYSPGDLVEKHSTLRCKDCHAPFKKVPSESCSKVKCHPNAKVGHKKAINELHAILKEQDCLICHTDHLGQKGKVTKYFNHKLILKIDICIDCHSAPKDKIHIKAASDCKACHEIKSWKPSTYNHDDYLFLDSNHNVICSKCHDMNIFKKYNCMNCHEHATRGIIREHTEEGIRDFGDCLRCHTVYFNERKYGTEKVRDSMIDDNDDDRVHDRNHKNSDDD